MKSLGLTALILATVLFHTAASAGCVANGCHAERFEVKYLHGPVAAEEAGAAGCVTCHTPAGPKCTPAKGGAYKLAAAKDKLCTSCHEGGAATSHSERKSACLKCHDPHGSDKGPFLVR